MKKLAWRKWQKVMFFTLAQNFSRNLSIEPIFVPWFPKLWSLHHIFHTLNQNNTLRLVLISFAPFSSSSVVLSGACVNHSGFNATIFPLLRKVFQSFFKIFIFIIHDIIGFENSLWCFSQSYSRILLCNLHWYRTSCTGVALFLHGVTLELHCSQPVRIKQFCH